MVTVAVKDEYAKALATFGDIEQAVNVALQRYAIEKITSKLAELRQREAAYQEKYGLDFAAFSERVAHDAAFVDQIEQSVSKTWELDLADWEFCHKGVEDWTQQLQTLLLA